VSTVLDVPGFSPGFSPGVFLAWLFVTRGVPKYIRSDNGPEFTARAVRDWLKRIGVGTLFIEPGGSRSNRTSVTCGLPVRRVFLLLGIHRVMSQISSVR